MKHFTLKLFLLIACLCGATSVWAKTTNAVVKMTWVDYNNPDVSQGEIAAGSTARAGYNKISGGTVAFANTAWGENKITYLQVDASAVDGSITKAALTFEVSGSTDSKRNTGWGAGYNSSAWSADMTYNTADKSITTCGEMVWTSTKSSTVFETKSIDITDALKDDEDKIATVLIYETAAAGGYIKNPSVVVEYVPAGAATTSITVKYVDENNVEVKPSVTVDNQAVGATYTLTNEDKASFTSGDFKYVYASDDAASKTIAADGSTVVTVVFHAIGKYNYSVKNNFGDIISSGSAFADETVNVYWSKYVNNEGKWFSTASPYGIVISEATDYVVNYTTEEDIAYFFESENLKKSRSAAATNTGTSYSGGYSPRHYSNSYWYTNLLQPGTYKILVPYQNNNSGSTDFELRLGDDGGNYDEDVIGNWTGAARTTSTLEATFTIPAGTEKAVYIYNNTQWNSNCYMDWIYIQRTGNIATTDISSVEYRTYITPFDVDFSKTEDLTAYVVTSAQRGESGIQYTEVTSVPANTPVILHGAEGTYNIYESAYTGEAITNVLKTGPVTVSDDNYGTIFVLNTGANGVGFYLLNNGKTLSEGKCYLEIPKNGTDDGAKFIGFHVGDATANDSVRQMDNNDAAIYNLAGQRVMVPTKGLYIVNGKKVFIK